jgi:exosortase
VNSTLDYVPATTAASPETSTTAVSRWRRPLLLLVAVELAVVCAPTVAWLFDRWTLSVWQNAHGMFVPPLAIWLAWQELRARPELPLRGSAWGFVFLLPALALHAVDAGLHSQLLSALALFLAIPGLALVLIGPARTRQIAFPLAFLAFAIPIPLAFTEPIHMFLRQIVAASTATFLPHFGVSVFRDGTDLHTTGGTINIIDACSGFSTLYAAAAVAFLAAYATKSWRRRILVLVAAAPIAIAANLLRVLVLTLAVIWYGNWVLASFLHPLSGMLTFALALPPIFWLGGPATRYAND